MGLHHPCYTLSVEGSAQAREQKVAKMLPRSCFLGGTGAKTALNAPVGLHYPCYTPSVEGSAQSREQKVAKMLLWSSFLWGTGAKTGLNAPVGLHHPCYTPSVEGSAQAREQKCSKMLSCGCTTPVIRLLLRGQHKHGSKKCLKCSRGHVF